MFDVCNYIYMLYSGHAIHVICDNQPVYKVQRLLRVRSVQRADLSWPSMCLLWGHRKQDYIILALVRKSVFFFKIRTINKLSTLNFWNIEYVERWFLDPLFLVQELCLISLAMDLFIICNNCLVCRYSVLDSVLTFSETDLY